MTERNDLPVPAEVGLDLHMLRHEVVEAAKNIARAALARTEGLPENHTALLTALHYRAQQLIAGEEEHAKILAANPPADVPFDAERAKGKATVCRAPQTEETPPQHIIDLAIQMSVESPCRSKRGAVLFVGDDVVSHGRNYKPEGFACDGSAACKATCRTDAIHAEQRALLAAGPKAMGAAFLHVKTVDGALVVSGGPSCVQCSKLALAAGVTGMWLYHETGWKWYAAEDWHRLSLLAAREPREPHAALVKEIDDSYGRLLQIACDDFKPDPDAYSGTGACLHCGVTQEWHLLRRCKAAILGSPTEGEQG